MREQAHQAKIRGFNAFGPLSEGNRILKTNHYYYIAFIILSICAATLAIHLNHSEPSVNVAENQSSQVQSEPVTSSISQSQQQSSEELLANEDESLDESIYDVELMKKNGIEAINPEDYASVDEIINEQITQLGIDPATVSIAFHNYLDDQRYYLNENVFHNSASIYKVPLAAMVLDLVNSGVYSMDSQIPFQDSYYQEGAGAISNNELRPSYSIQELIDESLIHSDNTAAWTLMMGIYGDFPSSRQALLDFLNYYDVPDNFYQDIYFSANLIEMTYDKIMIDPAYEYIITQLSQAEPHQLFTSYVKSGMANKYGRYESMVNDSGIYYENGQPIYSLVILTDGAASADVFLEMTNLNINQWVRHQAGLDQRN